ncbi:MULTISPECIES: hypothetical protein [Sphingomonadaceae]|jgi:hypothetical protein|uniref:Uncharacterized protein n=4 Tax=Sphingomonadaceae TaxID=41297 RepID=F6ETH5_SPHCR|nr:MULTISPECIES: hypothetical protein [Sphingomonadaceae]AEG48635.1 hypothetical protein Sphch_0944 [Sphingobium chlorophenolicum L-1]AMK18183.1 hypothetical protein K663_09010 [Sphingobium sp. MI1205]KEQ55513.1 hypothetical protein BV95_00152 [Sphingobium chlorophenolicum]RIA46531.1 hypothetical protein DFR49_1073 [Hephaestia caeni]UZW56030.1 hypothetical protein NUH86_04360 [Sphingobium sp. JS3065]
MSRHELDPLAQAASTHGALSIAIGWDAPLNSYFAIVQREDDDVDDDDRDLLWIGTRYGEILEPATVIDVVRPFAAIRDDLAATLGADRFREGSRLRAPWIR